MFSNIPWSVIRQQAQRALAVWAPPQSGLPKLQEECAELIAAVNQYSYGRLASDELATEIADVLLMAVQAVEIVGEELVLGAVKTKLARLTRRLDMEDAWGARGPLPWQDTGTELKVRSDLMRAAREPTDDFLEELFRDFRPLMDVKEWRRRLYHRAVGHYLEHR